MHIPLLDKSEETLRNRHQDKVMLIKYEQTLTYNYVNVKTENQML